HSLTISARLIAIFADRTGRELADKVFVTRAVASEPGSVESRCLLRVSTSSSLQVRFIRSPFGVRRSRTIDPLPLFSVVFISDPMRFLRPDLFREKSIEMVLHTIIMNCGNNRS
ncbi:hypothetical protein PFISCL1PPCAC_2458, partial [Pristionchus fissidentatus]